MNFAILPVLHTLFRSYPTKAISDTQHCVLCAVLALSDYSSSLPNNRLVRLGSVNDPYMVWYFWCEGVCVGD